MNAAGVAPQDSSNACRALCQVRRCKDNQSSSVGRKRCKAILAIRTMVAYAHVVRPPPHSHLTALAPGLPSTSRPTRGPHRPRPPRSRRRSPARGARDRARTRSGTLPGTPRGRTAWHPSGGPRLRARAPAALPRARAAWRRPQTTMGSDGCGGGWTPDEPQDRPGLRHATEPRAPPCRPRILLRIDPGAASERPEVDTRSNPSASSPHVDTPSGPEYRPRIDPGSKSTPNRPQIGTELSPDRPRRHPESTQDCPRNGRMSSLSRPTNRPEIGPGPPPDRPQIILPTAHTSTRRVPTSTPSRPRTNRTPASAPSRPRLYPKSITNRPSQAQRPLCACWCMGVH